MSILRASGVCIKTPERELLRDADIELAPGRRAGLVGPNGSGKSTLLRTLATEAPPDAGLVDLPAWWQVTWVRQADEREPGRPRQGAPLGASSVRRILGRLTQVDLARPSLSGGEATRVALAEALAAPADLLLLDEPSTHLDADGIEWLRQTLVRQPAAAVIVSHDRALLDAVTTETWWLDDGNLRRYAGAYTTARAAREGELARAWEAFEQASRRARRMAAEAGALKSRARAFNEVNKKRLPDGNTKGVQDRIQRGQKSLIRRALALERRLEREEAPPKPREPDARPRFRAVGSRRGGRVLEVSGLDVTAGDRVLVRGLEWIVRSGERWSVTGPNGAGKTTLLGALRARGKGVRWSSAARIFEMTQNLAGVRFDLSVSDLVASTDPEARDSDVQRVLVAARLPRETWARPAGLVSPGERARALLARLLLTTADTLLLDEPTAHLDIVSIEALEEALIPYPGAIILVSHDRRLRERVTDRELALDGRGGWSVHLH